MSFKLNLGLSKKVGLPDYGSLGATCHVETDLDGSLLNSDLEGFHRHVREIYVACSQAVHDELVRQQAVNGNGGTPQTTRTQNSESEDPLGHSHRRNGNGQQASQKQLEYIEQLARQIHGLGTRRLETLAEKMFAKPMAGLSSMDASGLIDTLKEIKSGRIDLAAALNGSPS